MYEYVYEIISLYVGKQLLLVEDAQKIKNSCVNIFHDTIMCVKCLQNHVTTAYFFFTAMLYGLYLFTFICNMNNNGQSVR
jgi:hypothetical protein